MSGELVRLYLDSDEPICPASLPPLSSLAHSAHNRTLDAFYRAAEKGDDGEFVSAEMDRAYSAARELNRMYLYVESGTATYQGRPLTVESWHWRCQICGFVLPTAVKR